MEVWYALGIFTEGRVTTENSRRKELVKIASVDIRLEARNGKENLIVTLGFSSKKKKHEHISIDFTNSHFRLFNFISMLLHVLEVEKWSQLSGEAVCAFYNKNVIYRICNVKDKKLFLDFSEFFRVDC